ncbi:MAG: hypothetical protein LKG24_01720 [Lacticaseibacillus songhuajiangensis]|jgi:hypothetical protein|nr:hypothetical protein [Lacticaseibacillus songhuajiangensis]
MMQVTSRDIGYPKRNVITATVPFSSQEFDFSEAGGDASWGNRTIKYVISVLNINQLDPIEMHDCSTQLVNWLTNSHGRQALYDDAFPGYHFLGELRDAPSLADEVETGDLTVTFDCYAFMIRDYPEGMDLWPFFRFASDTLQTTEYDVNGTAQVLLINTGTQAATPTITADNQMTVTIGAIDYEVPKGISSGVKLPVGNNFITVNGQGHISFEWFKEVM